MINRFAEVCPTKVNQDNYSKAITWLGLVRRGLQAEADRSAITGYSASLDLDTPDSDRLFRAGEIDPRDEDYLAGIEAMTWNGHTLAAIARLEDIRADFEERTGEDIAVAQFTTLQVVLDRA